MFILYKGNTLIFYIIIIIYTYIIKKHKNIYILRINLRKYKKKLKDIQIKKEENIISY